MTRNRSSKNKNDRGWDTWSEYVINGSTTTRLGDISIWSGRRSCDNTMSQHPGDHTSYCKELCESRKIMHITTQSKAKKKYSEAYFWVTTCHSSENLCILQLYTSYGEIRAALTMRTVLYFLTHRHRYNFAHRPRRSVQFYYKEVALEDGSFSASHFDEPPSCQFPTETW